MSGLEQKLAELRHYKDLAERSLQRRAMSARGTPRPSVPQSPQWKPQRAEILEDPHAEELGQLREEVETLRGKLQARDLEIGQLNKNNDELTLALDKAKQDISDLTNKLVFAAAVQPPKAQPQELELPGLVSKVATQPPADPPAVPKLQTFVAPAPTPVLHNPHPPAFAPAPATAAAAATAPVNAPSSVSKLFEDDFEFDALLQPQTTAPATASFMQQSRPLQPQFPQPAVQQQQHQQLQPPMQSMQPSIQQQPLMQQQYQQQHQQPLMQQQQQHQPAIQPQQPLQPQQPFGASPRTVSGSWTPQRPSLTPQSAASQSAWAGSQSQSQPRTGVPPWQTSNGAPASAAWQRGPTPPPSGAASAGGASPGGRAGISDPFSRVGNFGLSPQQHQSAAPSNPILEARNRRDSQRPSPYL